MRQPVTFVKGDGVWLWDDKGEKYLDALAGVKPEIRILSIVNSKTQPICRLNPDESQTEELMQSECLQQLK